MSNPKPATGQLKVLESKFLETYKKRNQSEYSNNDIMRIFDRLKSRPVTEAELMRLEKII